MLPACANIRVLLDIQVFSPDRERHQKGPVMLDAQPVTEVGGTASDSQDGSRQPLGHAMLSAFIAIQFALISGFWYQMIGLGKIDWSRFSGYLIAPKAADVTQYLLGYLASSVNGFIFGLVFVYLIRPLIPLPSNRIANFFAGQAMGVVLSVIALAWWTPANFPAFNPGAFSTNLGYKIVVGTFVWHAAYFLNLTSFLDVLGPHPWQTRRIGLRQR